MNEKHYQFFQNRQCEYFPCHAGVPTEDFNCLFCYCPLYALGRKCGGRCHYSDSGTKECTNCTFPHRRENYSSIIARYADIKEVVKKMDREDT